MTQTTNVVTISTSGKQQDGGQVVASLEVPSGYEIFLGSHRTLKERFIVFKGTIQLKDGKPVFVDEDGTVEDLWKAIPYRVLSEGCNLGIAVSAPGVTMVTRGVVAKKKQQKNNKTSWVWRGPGGEVSVGFVLDRLLPFLPIEAGKVKIKIVVWK